MKWELYRPEDRARWWLREELYTISPRTPLSKAIINDLCWDEGAVAIGEYLNFPDSIGFSVRTINGYTFLSPIPITDPNRIQQRLEHFMARMSELQANLDRNLKAYHEEQEREQAYWRGIDLGNLATMELLEQWRRMINTLYRFWKLHFMIVFPRHAIQGTLETTVQELASVPTSEIGKLVQSMGRTRQLELDASLWKLAKRAIQLGLRDTFLNTMEEDLQQALELTESGKAWLVELRAFLERYGSRSPNSLELFEPAWDENPMPVLNTVRSYIAQGGEFDFDRLMREKRAERDEFTRSVLAKITNVEARERVEGMLEPSRKFQAAMEDDNFYFLWANIQMRRVAKECGVRLVSCGVLAEPDDVFFLEPREIEQSLFDAVVDTYDLRQIAAQVRHRRAEWEDQSATQPPPYIGNPPEIIEDFMMNHFWGIKTRQQLEESSSGNLTGSGASGGVVEGVARLVMNPVDFGHVQPGEVLVCRSTNPAWTPLFSKVSAVVTDQGGTLCHAAIVAREYGIPAVVGTIHGTRRISEGAKVRVDGSAGTVILL